MNFGQTRWNKWKWRASLARRLAKRKGVSFDSFFPMCFVPESSAPRRKAV